MRLTSFGAGLENIPLGCWYFAIHFMQRSIQLRVSDSATDATCRLFGAEERPHQAVEVRVSLSFAIADSAWPGTLSVSAVSRSAG